MVRIGLIVAVVLATASCGEASLPANLVAPDVVLDRDEAAALQQAVSACPGILTYLPDTRIVAAEHINDATAFTFSVPLGLSRVPPEFIANGHNCMLTVRPTGIGIAKRACVSICRERRINDDHPQDSLEYPLN